MSLFRKKCEYCKENIAKGKEVFRNVKDPTFVGTKKKAFCSDEHVNSYEIEVKECCKNSKSRSCCS